MASFLAAHLGSRQVSRVIYGAIISLALVLALEAKPAAPGTVVATLAGTAVAVGLAELYSELVGLETRGRRASRAERRNLLGDTAAVVSGIAFPALFFVLAAAGVLDDGTAFTVAKWTGVGVIGLYGFAGARMSGGGVVASLAQALAVALIGALLIALKAVVH